ncbi:aldo/keto reductase [Pararhodobacter sp. SW119]|uniref:aldo/keto reductase n=1 Tax=Pararhodobacter sp. SW119 TaxID=2780075 RepID=UPI001ADFA4F0|nr:aldo/keto reductase [Pararhodobacter sp. SW119]
MQKLSLAAAGFDIPAWCLGTMTWGTQTPAADAHRQIDMALEHGIPFLDAAEMYPVNPVSPETRGRTEEIIGEWIARNRGRDRPILASKVTGTGSEVIEGGAPAIDAARLRSAVEDVLGRLQTDVIDIYQLHWPNRGTYHFRKSWVYAPPEDSRDAVREHMLDVLTEAQKLIAEGKIRAIAMSNETAWGLANWIALAEANGLPRPVTVQNEYSLLCRIADTDMAELCKLEGVPLLAFSPLAAGLMTGKYAGDVIPDGSRRSHRPDLGGRITPRVFEAVAAYLGLARERGLEPVQMALAWVRSRPFPVVPILGATTAEQLALQLPATALTLDDDLLAAIDAVHKAHPMPY